MIIFHNILIDPYPIYNSYYIINGQIDYQLTIQPSNSDLDFPPYLINLNLSLNAELINFCSVCEPPFNNPPAGTILIKTNDSIYISEKGNYLLEKSFQIQGRKDEMYLVCRFKVTLSGIEIDRIVLHLEPGNEDDHLQLSL